ncbi:MAG: imidazole glycerol phosphate synthase subunit HisH [Rhodospirillales bacterium CG15_BIG_FIL_POST_REV_8_21_14_020_66_15]|nr:MAG: imidazole glycerol phosphate synthase subunit HisH [Rhodospirillales bacterium CG15_BIG_FIL_POST_REV_8_21_14_020_66_15]
MIAIVDIGVGNLGAIKNMLRKVGAAAQITDDAEAIRAADKIVLPGVGAFDQGMRALAASGLTDVLNEQALDARKPILGICLGAQMLGRKSEEGTLPGLGWIDMDVVRFPRERVLKVPHMGWNTVSPAKVDGAGHPMFGGGAAEPRFYFVHSYFMECDRAEDVAATCDYGRRFAAAVARGNIWGVQFHPEKSHKFGAALLRNFAENA